MAQLQGLTSTICGKYCLFAFYMDRGYTPNQFVGLYNVTIAEKQVNRFFASEFGTLSKHHRGGQCTLASIKATILPLILNSCLDCHLPRMCL